MKSWPIAKRLLVRRAIVAAIAFMAFVQAFYHLATGGLPSFITEITVAVVLGVCLWLTRLTACQPRKWILATERSLLIIMALVFLTAGIYHGTHEGYYSGVLQPIGAGLLGFAAYLSFLK
ncbi:MAG: hypothetical protein N3E40_05610 [Dehalococcoidia bacterium]|nr:hypothetical protein [Dehalococcoidia bacterium]